MSDQTLYNYLTRDSEPNRLILIKLAVAAGVSVEWLATGKDPAELDLERLRDVIEGVETWLKMSRRKMTPTEKAEVIIEIYEEVLGEELAPVAPVEPRPARIHLRLVEKSAA